VQLRAARADEGERSIAQAESHDAEAAERRAALRHGGHAALGHLGALGEAERLERRLLLRRLLDGATGQQALEERVAQRVALAESAEQLQPQRRSQQVPAVSARDRRQAGCRLGADAVQAERAQRRYVARRGR